MAGSARLLIAAVLLGAPAAVAADPTGRVTGTVRLAGALPGPRPPLPATVDPHICGPTVPDDSLVVAGNGGVQDAAVVLRGGPPAVPAPRPEALIDNARCRFVPRVQVVVRGQTVRVRNSDAALHNTHAMLAGEPEVAVANLALALRGQTMDLTRRLAAKLPPSGEALVRLGCDVHPWMRGWLVVLDHPRGTVTDAEGRFAIAEVPPGSYTVAVWHERLGRAERRVSVRPGATATADVELRQP